MVSTSAVSSRSPREQYQQRLEHFRTQHALQQARLAWLGNLRFVLFALAFVLFWPAVIVQVWPLFALLGLPVVGFVVLAFPFVWAKRADRQASRAIAYYERGLARLDDRWAGTGIPGKDYANEHHLYAADLDLFGSGSLFERLCSARTRVGRDTLARWLSAPGTLPELTFRHAAVRELRDLIAWREQLMLVSGAVPEGVDTSGLTAWAGKLAQTPVTWVRYAAPVLVALTGATGIASLFGWNVAWLALALLIQGAFALWVAPRVRHALDGLHGRSLDLFHLTRLLTALERATFTAPRLVELQAALRSEGQRPSERLTHLAQLIDWLDSTKNQLFGVIAPFLLWKTRTAFLVELWRWQTAAALPRWVLAVGEMEALTSLAGYAYENPDDPFPELVAEGPLLEGVGLGHPLLPRRVCVTNDVCLSSTQRLLLVSGSNMSGKSTFLRTVGINAVLALAGAPVRASKLRLSPLALGATLRIQDSLQEGKSRFYAEITRLRQVIDLTQQPLPLLYLFDEILHGTNSHDRRIGTEGILRTLLERSAIGLVTTHDLALTQIAANREPLARNVHFEDQLVDGTLHFDYRLRPGVVQHSNALALMRAVGIQVGEADSA